MLLHIHLTCLGNVNFHLIGPRSKTGLAVDGTEASFSLQQRSNEMDARKWDAVIFMARVRLTSRGTII